MINTIKLPRGAEPLTDRIKNGKVLTHTHVVNIPEDNALILEWNKIKNTVTYMEL